MKSSHSSAITGEDQRKPCGFIQQNWVFINLFRGKFTQKNTRRIHRAENLLKNDILENVVWVGKSQEKIDCD